MNIASWLGAKIFGEVIADLGSIQTSKKSDNWRLALTLRRKSGETLLVFHWNQGREKSWMSVQADPSTLEKLEEMIRDAREKAKSFPSS
jgi:hypothetical protein